MEVVLLYLEVEQEVALRQVDEVLSMAVVQLEEVALRQVEEVLSRATMADVAPEEEQGRYQTELFHLTNKRNLHLKLLKTKNTNQVILMSRWPRRRRGYGALFARKTTLRTSVHY